VVLARICPLKKLEDGFSFQGSLGIFHQLDVKRPVVGKRIPAGRPGMLDPALAGQFTAF